MISKQINLLLIDNKDSFTYNLLHLFESVGCKVKVSNSKSGIDESFRAYSHIVFSPGPGVPDDFPQMAYVLKYAPTDTKILGVCLGHQAIANYFGAKLYQMENIHHGQKAAIQNFHNDIKSCIFDLPDVFYAGIYHSWAVQPESLPKHLLVTCQSESGIIMGVKHQQLPIEGIQFHPESFLTEFGTKIIKNWIAS